MHLAAGKSARILCNQYNIPFIWIRIFSIDGKYDRPNSMISTTIRKMLDGVPCQFTPAEQIWDFFNADDMGSAFFIAGKVVKEDKIYCVGSGDARPLKDYITIIRDVVNPEADLVFGQLPYPEKPIMRLCPNISDIVRDTGWKPKVSFADGVREIAEMLKK